MRVLIVEDETAAYENLVDILKEVAPDIRIVGNTESVTQTIHWLQTNPAPELIFMDIHLSDGSAFNIFDKVELETPIVFTTAYDRYAIEAFKVNSIDYLLKPIKVEDIKHALDKYGKLNRQDLIQYLSQLTRLAPAPKYKDKFLLPYKDKLLPVSVKDISRFSLYRITIDTDKCNGCGLCARQCKAACIDSKEHKVDGSRCVACMNCLEVCRKDALRYAPVWKAKKQANLSRRRALSATALVVLGGTLKAQEKKVEEVIMKRDGGLAPIKERKETERLTAIVPPGAQSIQNMRQHCTACQLCISVCPNHVLRPSGGLMTLMQPEMSYERGYCRPECTKCSEVCPAGAITLITKADKSSVQIGHAVWVKANCIPLTDGVECGNCSRHCPTNAIEMVASDPGDPKSLKIPVVNTERCIGCGACENLCPSRPFTAIYVEGHERHRII